MNLCDNMKLILVLFCTLSVVYSRPPAQSQVKIDVHRNPGLGTDIRVNHSGHVEGGAVHVSHKQERNDFHLSGGPHSGASGSNGHIVTYGLNVPARLSGHINLY